MTKDHQDHRTERDDVATLLRVAGKRPPVPQDRADRVRAAGRERWDIVVGRRKQRRFRVAVGMLATAASIAVIATVWLVDFGTGTLPGDDRVAWVEERVGSTSAEPNSALAAGGVLSTGKNGRLALRFASGHSVRVDYSSTVRLLDERTLVLERGALYVDSGSYSNEGSKLEIRTPLGSIHETGTQYEVRLDDESTRVRLREGSVVVRHDGQSHEVSAGDELLIGADGSAMWTPLSIHGGSWSWLIDVTPMPDFDGENAHKFLEWVARERGWQLVFASEAVADASETTILGGTFGDLTLPQALDAVLPTCRMTYDVRDGILLIDTE
ncbi:MAG: FecR family protein [Acidobacteriota bacterium]|nr:FecR family protein [Acidobacteriota bacterium]MDH3785364.1 FecR family protein [Acidobacteriota bacterium]